MCQSDDCADFGTLIEKNTTNTMKIQQILLNRSKNDRHIQGMKER